MYCLTSERSQLIPTNSVKALLSEFPFAPILAGGLISFAAWGEIKEK